MTNQTANEHFTDAFFRFMDGWGAVLRFRQVAQAGIPIAERTAFRQHLEVADSMSTKPDYAHLFQRGDIDEVAAKSAFAEAATDQFVTNTHSAIDAASLVFVHAILDNASFDYLRCTALANVLDWKDIIKGKQVTVEQIESLTPKAIYESIVNDILKRWEKESLLFKIDRLFAICSPDSNFDPIKDFTFDQSRLKRLDDARHSIAHRDGIHTPIPHIDQELRFLSQCCLFCGSLVISKYGLQVDWEYYRNKPRSAVDIASIVMNGERPNKENES